MPTLELLGERPTTSRGHVLLVEHQEVLARLIHGSLTRAGYKVMMASDADAALHIVGHGRRFDAIVCELAQQDLTGADLFEWVHLFDPTQAARWVFLSRDMGELQSTCSRCGAKGLGVPFTPDELLAACEQAAAG